MWTWFYNWLFGAPASRPPVIAPHPAHPKQHPADTTGGSTIVVVAAALSALETGVAVGEQTANIANGDELDAFQTSLNAETGKLRGKIEEFQAKKVQLLASIDPLISSAVTDTKAASALSHIFQMISKAIYDFIETPSSNIKDALTIMAPHFEQQQQHVSELIQRLHRATDESEKTKIKIEICDVNIDLLKRMLGMIIDIGDKIRSSVTVDVAGEKVALSLLSITLLIVFQIAFPNLDSAVEEEIRDYMGRSIREPGSELDKFLVQLDAEIAKSLQHVDGNQVDACVSAPVTSVSSAAAAAAAAVGSTLSVDTGSPIALSQSGASLFPRSSSPYGVAILERDMISPQP